MKRLKQFLVIVRSTVHLRSSIQKTLLLLSLLLLLLLLLLKERNTGGFIVYRPVWSVIHVRIIEIREFRLEGLYKTEKRDEYLGMKVICFPDNTNFWKTSWFSLYIPSHLLLEDSFFLYIKYTKLNTFYLEVIFVAIFLYIWEISVFYLYFWLHKKDFFIDN